MNQMTMPPVVRHRVRAWIGLPVLLAVAGLAFALHIGVGAKPLSVVTVFEALTRFDPNVFDHAIVVNLRLPRAVFALVVGAGLSLAGAIMQGVTRNPLADPALLGLTTGAAFAVVLATSVFGITVMALTPWIAMAGALGAAIIVYVIARLAPGGATPLSMTLAGASVSAFLAAVTSVVHLLNQDTFENLRVWLTGGLAGRDITLLVYVGPPMAIALVAGILLAPRVTVLAMGDEVAQALGVRTAALKAQLLAVVVVLTACSVALAGPLGFIGLVIPHVVRLYVGSDYRWIVPYAALTGAIYLLSVDIVARIAIPPREISTGIITAMIGAPLFVHLVRRRTR
ncbi:iron complex transport system permease protein [Devosia lucknowensis]|uniref:Iron complex transport system permease protein n=1 Tax=Devosia lucknowensis TaxID=1096929 RepID=A0A1Y6G9N7_9HYPH|nr:iron ABC transporter permease [Devosia lucknowensis]SMQ85408.1 iron complex transport system permease protein [Devosia lucknowensis]